MEVGKQGLCGNEKLEGKNRNRFCLFACLQRHELLLLSFLFPPMHSACTFKIMFYLPSTLLRSAMLMCLFFHMLSIYLWDLLVPALLSVCCYFSKVCYTHAGWG